MDSLDVQIEESWKEVLMEEFQKEYFGNLVRFLRSEKSKGKSIYPPGQLIFNAFNTTPFNKVKVVIIGQDPYHGPGQAMGLSFSVPKEMRIPPSLKNIFKEIHKDTGARIPHHGDLTSWATQGVFLLNAILTVERHKASSHKKKGWERFTDAVINKLSTHRKHLVFLLWGNYARSKKSLINTEKHLVLESYHPSPLARNKFFGNHHFSKTNSYLHKTHQNPINWEIRS